VFFSLGTLEGLISNLFLFGPGLVLVSGVVYLARKGFFGPDSQ
jgi:hypothetical protein